MKRPTMPRLLRTFARPGSGKSPSPMIVRCVAAVVAAVLVLVMTIVTTATADRSLAQYRGMDDALNTLAQADGSATSGSRKNDGKTDDSNGAAGADGAAESDRSSAAKQSDKSSQSGQSNTSDSSGDKSSSGKQNDASGSNSHNGTSDKSSDTVDAKAADIAKTLAADKSAQPLSDHEKTQILDQATSAAQAAADEIGAGPYHYTYCLRTKGNVGNTTAFANIVFSTLNNTKGWPRAGVTFEQTSEADCDSADMDIILSEARYMTDFSTMCSVHYSCRVGQQVIINDDRWNGSVDAWLDAGGTLSRYREMVVNHEVGHRLGHIDNETTCAGAGQRAPLMQEQSMHLDGCVPNEWPLDHELWVG